VATILIIDALTGDVSQRPFTEAELSQRHADEELAQAEAKTIMNKATAREAAKASALAKLEALGLTADEAQAIAGF
jgi:hypothetical protein